MEDTIEQCEKKFGTAPRSFSSSDRKFLDIKKPDWVREDMNERLSYHFQYLSQVFQGGKIRWGQIIQANELLFSRGNDDYPGEIVYAPDGDVDPTCLWEIAEEIRSLKNTRPKDVELSKIAFYLTDERIRTYGTKFPSKVIPDKNFRISTTWFPRKHLPAGCLRCELLPVIVHLEVGVLTPLPHRYWPKEFEKWWRTKKYWEQ
ncbi:MAG: hypothetical protein P1V20_20775 [Verrucomicrobiales bacterium]|nr:hypothetical protein [Verrucomicrobiales bacterium]